MIVVDAGVFVAGLFPNDRYHEVCRAFLSDPGDEIGTSALVVAEVCHLFKRSPHQPQPEVAFLRLLASGKIISLAPTRDDYDRMADLVAGMPAFRSAPRMPRSSPSPNGSALPGSLPSTAATSWSCVRVTSRHSS